MTSKANKLVRYKHTRDRMKERFNIDLSLEEYDKLCEKVEKSGTVVEEYSKNRETRLVSWEKRFIAVGYNKKYKLVNTIMVVTRDITSKYTEIKKNNKTWSCVKIEPEENGGTTYT